MGEDGMIQITGVSGTSAITEALSKLKAAGTAIISAGTTATNAVNGEMKANFTKIYNTGNSAVFVNVEQVVNSFISAYEQAMSKWSATETEINDAMATALAAINNISNEAAPTMGNTPSAGTQAVSF